MAIETYHNAVYQAGSSGEQAILQVNPNHVSSVSVVASDGGTSYDIQFQLINGGTRWELLGNQSGTTTTFLDRPVTGIGINLDGGGIVGTVTVEVRTASRGS